MGKLPLLPYPSPGIRSNLILSLAIALSLKTSMLKHSRGKSLATTLARAFALALSLKTSMQKHFRGKPFAETASLVSPNLSPTQEGKGKGTGKGENHGARKHG